MAFEVCCPNCGAMGKADDHLVGTKLRCSNCKGIFTDTKLRCPNCKTIFTNRHCPRCGALVPSQAKPKGCGETSPPGPATQSSGSLYSGSLVGSLMLIGGLIGAAYFFFFFETSVDVPPQKIFGQTVERVNNLGLMAQRQNGIIFSFGVAIVGALIEFFSRSRK